MIRRSFREADRRPSVGAHNLDVATAGHPLVYDMIEQHIEETNRALSADKVMA